MLAASLFPDRFAKLMACVVFDPADIVESPARCSRLLADGGYPGVVLINSARVPTRVCGHYRSKNTALGVFMSPEGVLGTCFAL
jgi:hypothetical protein